MKIISLALFVAGIFVPRTEAYEAECHLPLDVVFLQDTTGSFDDDLPNVVKQIPDMIIDISRVNPNSRFGVAEFHDKPFYPLGIEDDFCYKIGGPLTNSTAEFRDAYSLLYASGGSDLPEATYHALINVLEDASVGWRPLATSRAAVEDPTVAGARVVIMSTDAVPHLPNDYLNMYDHISYPDLPSHLPPYSGSPLPIQGDNIDWQCATQDYPAPDQVRAVYLKHSAYLVILTPEDPAITAAWQWVNRDLFQQPDEFYQYINADSSNILDGVLSALRAVTATACATTTVEPTTTATTVVQTTIPSTTLRSTTLQSTTNITTTFTTASSEAPSSTTEIDLDSTSEDDATRLPAEDSTTPLVSTAPVSATTEDVIPTVGQLTLTSAAPTVPTVAVLTPTTPTEAVPTVAPLPITTATTSISSSVATEGSSIAATLSTAATTTLQTDSSTLEATSPTPSPLLTESSVVTASTDASSEVTPEDEVDCCPHVEIKMMKAPKQWKMMVVN